MTRTASVNSEQAMARKRMTTTLRPAFEDAVAGL
jgi:hypothetical protein